MLNNRTDRIKILALVIFVIEVGFATLFINFLNVNANFLLVIFLIITFFELIYIFYVYEQDKKKKNMDISRILGTEARGAFEHGQVGIIVYDDNHTVIWENDYFIKQGMDFIGEKISKCLPGVQGLFKGNVYNMVIELNDRKYEIVKGDGEQVVYAKDVTELVELRENYKNEKLVLGLISLDNYEETVQNEDEQMIASINTNIRQRVVKWAIDNGGVIRRLRSDRFLVIINHQNFVNMLATKFLILDEVKKEAANLNVAITCSMSFAYGSERLSEIDEEIGKLLELVLSRGGDQVAVREIGQEVSFYGASSSANEKTSKVRARVMAQGLRGIIDDSSNVIIIPHNDADLDSFGSALGLSKIAQACGKTSYIVMNDIKVEPKTLEIYDNSVIELIKDHIFVSIGEALSVLDEQTLVIATDHHSLDLTSAPQVINAAKKVVILDHHRRKSEAIQAMMIYNEPAASSSVELVSELLQYQSKNIELTELEASIMYAGLLVDTDELKSRCSVRTFEACAFLKKQGCDMAMANEWLRDSLEDFINKANISKHLDYVGNGFAVSAVVRNSGEFLSRTALAQGANYICAVKEVSAAFVIGQIDANTYAISARSNGEVNVQIIMEKMGGGGHFNASGLQRTNTSVEALKEELLKVIEAYNNQGGNNEGNTIS